MRAKGPCSETVRDPRWMMHGRPEEDPERASRGTLGLWALLAGIALVLAACTTGPKSPTVASLGNAKRSATSSTSTGGGGSGTTVPKGNATELLNRWSSCMRAHGDPNQSDPTIDSHGVIYVTIPKGVSERLSGQVHSGNSPCNGYLAAAQNVLRAADPVAPPPTQAQLVQYVDCMRTHGVPNYPNSGSNGETNFRVAGVNPSSPTFVKANKVCGRQIHAPAWWISGTGPPGDVVVSSAGIGPNGPVPGSRPPRG